MAEMRIDQATPGTGTPGHSRHDLVPGEVIALTATTPVGAGVTYTWEILDKVGSDAVLSSTSAQSVTIGLAGSIVELCAFRVRLLANDNGVITQSIRVISVRGLDSGLRPPLFAETAPRDGTLSSNLPDSSTDNAVYTDRAGLGVSEQNWRGWAEWGWEVTATIENLAGAGGGPPSGSASGDLSGTYPNPVVAKIRGRVVDSAAPNDGQIYTWDNGLSKWVLADYRLQTVYEQDNTVDVSSGVGSLTLTNSVDTTKLLTLIHSFSGAGSGLAVVMGAGSTDAGISISAQVGVDAIHAENGGNTLSLRGDLVKITGGQFQGGDGLVSAPTYSFSSLPGHGVYLESSKLAFAVSGVRKLALTAFNMTADVTLQVPDGDPGAPGLTFNDTTKGIYSSGANSVGISVASTLQLSVDTAGIKASSTAQFAARNTGGAAAPGYAFGSRLDQGLFSVSATAFATAAGGIETSRHQLIGGSFAQVLYPDGVEGTPSIAIGQTDNGFYQSVADQISLAINGNQYLIFQPGTPVSTGRANDSGSSKFIALADHVHDTPISIANQTSSFSLTASHDYLRITAIGAVTVTLPNPSTVGSRRWRLLLSHNTPGDVTLSRFGSETIQGIAANYVLSDPWTRWELVCDGTNWWLF